MSWWAQFRSKWLDVLGTLVFSFSPNVWISWGAPFLVQVKGYFGYPSVYFFSGCLDFLRSSIPGPSERMFWVPWCVFFLSGCLDVLRNSIPGPQVTRGFGYPGVFSFSPNVWISWGTRFLVQVTGWFESPGVFNLFSSFRPGDLLFLRHAINLEATR